MALTRAELKSRFAKGAFPTNKKAQWRQIGGGAVSGKAKARAQDPPTTRPRVDVGRQTRTVDGRVMHTMAVRRADAPKRAQAGHGAEDIDDFLASIPAHAKEHDDSAQTRPPSPPRNAEAKPGEMQTFLDDVLG